MNNNHNLNIYHLWSPIYDFIFGPVFRTARRQAIQHLTLQTGQNLLIPGIGTGLDLPFLQQNIEVIGIDISESMLRKARKKANTNNVSLQVMDAQQLKFPNEHFDAVLMNLVLSVVPDGERAFQEAWRVLRPNGQIVIFDKFLPEDRTLSSGREFIGQIIRMLGTDPNRRFSEIVDSVQGLSIKQEIPSLFGGQYRIISGIKSVGVHDIESRR